ncbi:TPA: ATP-binding cassette domain-containing protein [Streptococcus agalactiae]
MSYALVLKGLKKVYATGVEALRGIDLTVEEGDFYALLGPNGAGKSTTLNTYSHWFNALDKTVSEEITQNIKSAGLDSILCQNSCQTSN